MTKTTGDGLAVSVARAVWTYEADTGVIRWVGGIKGIPAGGVAGGAKGGPHGAYSRVTFGGRRIYCHRLAWALHYGEWPKASIDHVNGDKGDNRIVNLRLADQAQNGHNRGANSNNKAGLKGVCFHRGTGKWKAEIMARGKRRHLGLFQTPKEAHAAYSAAAASLHQDFARVA
jgi:hypothetical protein